jgi:hypothetical protein
LLLLPCRTPAHCIEYAHLILWSQQRSSEEFDTDNEEHMQWVYSNALTRAKQYGIEVRAFLVAALCGAACSAGHAWAMLVPSYADRLVWSVVWFQRACNDIMCPASQHAWQRDYVLWVYKSEVGALEALFVALIPKQDA